MLRRWREQWAQARSAARSEQERRRFIVEYLALRAWSLLMGCFAVDANLATARLMGRIWWLISKKHRDRAVEHLRFAFPDRTEPELRRIARGAFEHFAQLYLVELVMTPRLVNEWSWSRYVELGKLGSAVRQMLAQRGVIIVTPHFGNFELMGNVVARLGLPITAVMRPLDNPLVTDALMASRNAGGLTLLYKKGVTQRAEQTLAAGGTLCFIADQDAGRKGVFAPFFNKQASWYKSIGLLAMQYQVPVVVGVAPRIKPGFRYRIEIERIIQPAEWVSRDDPLQWITETYAAALEAAIRRHPEQYLWIHRRWKSRPKGERDLTAS